MTEKKPIKSIKKQLRDYVYEYNVKCCYCGKSYNNAKIRPSIDHIVPKSSKGTTELDNIIVSCSICNSVKKKSMSLLEFIDKYPKSKYFLKKYINKMKKVEINKISYYNSIKWLEDFIK